MEPVISGMVDYTISKIDKYIVTPLASEATYVCFINSNFGKLKREVEMLEEKRECVQNMVSNARRNAEDIKHVVEKWLSEVDDIIRKYEGIKLDHEARHGRSCSNLVHRHKLSKQASKMVDEVIQLREKGSFDQVSSPGPLINQSSPQKIVGFLDFGSRVLTMNQIMDALEENHVNRIVVHGMGGVGKTMLMKEILRKIGHKKSFDEVVISTVSRTPNLKIIQGQLADMLGLKFEQETIVGRALKLRKRLMNTERILVVFDDVWEDIDLETIGIPNVKDHIGCKILFTSRERHLLSDEMCTSKTFEIKVLEKHESWNLFETIVSEIVEDRKSIADQIVKECAHLPISITTVAKALQNKPLHVWEDALNQLKKPVAVNIKGMDEKVYSSLKLSYDFLKYEDVKLLFLLCSMFPEDFDICIEDLQVYAMAMGFLDGVDTMAQGRCRIAKLVDDLISSSLLLQEESKDEYVKMHDLVREVAILISSKSDQIHTLSYVKRQNKEWEEDKLMDNYTAVYINICASHGPLQKLLIPKVQLLTLCGPPYDVMYELEESFFEEMEELKSLEVQWAKIPSFSLSLHSFANIRLLRLLDCDLENIDMIGELRRLEILSFKGSNISQIPTTISQLTQLKVLDLSLCEVKVIPPHILSRLTKLEELYLGSFDGWESDELYEGKKNASLSELKYLLELYAVDLRIQDEKVIPKQLFPKELNFKKFGISIGSKNNLYRWPETSRSMHLNIESLFCLDDWIKTLLKRSETLHLVGPIGTKILKFELDKNAFSHLKYLRLIDNLEFQHLIHEGNKPLRIMLSNLVELEMVNLENLESIINGYDRESSFNKLRVVNVSDCNKLETLFLNCNMEDILNLENIYVLGCKKVEVMFVMENEEAPNHIEFTHLKTLQLFGVHGLQFFCSKSEKHGQLRQAETSTINDVDSFFSEQVSLPNLETLIINGADNLKMIWHNIFIPHPFSKLKKVWIYRCNSLEKIFPSNMMSMLTCLNILDIRDCNSLQGIFEEKESTDTEVRAILIPKLRELKLQNLPNLEYIWSNDPLELMIFEDLKELCIYECPKLERLYPVKVLKQQQYVEIEVGALQEVIEKEKSTHGLDPMQFWTSQDGLELFPNVKWLTLNGSLDYKLTQLPIEVVRILHNLEGYTVTRTFIEEIFPNNVDEYHNTTTFMALTSLHLSELPKLRHIWKPSSVHNDISLLEELKYLTISRCSRLNTLLPSSMSFRSLVQFYVDKCHGLTNLMNHAVARVLVQLKYLILRNCKRMISVIATGGNEEGNYEIVFNNLRTLELSQLSKLTNFCSEKCIIRFPLLSDVTIEDCSEMKVFSMGMVATPSLPTKNITFINLNFEEIIVSDINVIFRQFWEDNSDVVNIKNLFAEEEILEENHSDSPS